MADSNGELNYLTIGEAAALIRDKKLSPVELTRAHLERIEAVDGEVRSYITLLEKEALAEARTAEEEIQRGGYSHCEAAGSGVYTAGQTSDVRVCHGGAQD